MSIGLALAVSSALLVANAFFVWAEFAVVAARQTRMEALAGEGSRRAASVLRAMQDLNFVLAGAQLGITMASLGLGFVAEPVLADLLEDPLHGLPEALAGGIEVALALGIVVAAHMVIGEMLPKNLAITEPNRSALWIVPAFRVYAAALRPAIALLNGIANGVLRVLRVPSAAAEPAHTPDEIVAMLKLSGAEGEIDPFEHRMLLRILSLRDLDARAAMVPRPDVVAVPVTATPADIGRLVVATGHSRLPVYRDTLDDVAGFIHVKDLLGVAADAWDAPVSTSLVRDALVVPESRSLLNALTDMRSRRVHVAVVVDEHGGVEGLLTLEDILEELVGDIRDEYDPGASMVWRVGARVVADGRLRLDEVESAVGLELPEGDYDTLGGFVMARLGQVPAPGDVARYEGWRIEVRRMAGHRVDLVEIEQEDGRSEPE
ncbi:MAG: HlyC/CorC family transporter [Actinobacteria bacterium]|nr:HlyC/CorC family transporter [Actinomycetota bacterium]